MQTAQDLLSRRSGQYSDRPRLVMAFELATKGMHILFRPYDAAYRLHRRMSSSLFHQRVCDKYQPFHDLESKQLLLDLLDGYDSTGEEGIKYHDPFIRAIASGAYSFLFGHRLKSAYEPELVHAQKVQDDFARTARVGEYLVDSFPVLNKLPRFLSSWKKEADILYQRESNLHLGNLARGLSYPGWNWCKSMMQSSASKDMTKIEVAFDVGVISDAALDTTTMTMEWFVVACVTEGEVFITKAQKLLDDVVGRDRLPVFADRPQLLYIEAIVQELLRWRPIVSGGVPHMIRSQDEYMGYRIPAGSIVLPNSWTIMRETAVFGENPDDFLPERWLADDAKLLNDGRLKDLPAPWFGFGRRACPGRHIAQDVLWIQIVRLLWAFEIESGFVKETGERILVDSLACTDGFVTKPVPSKAVFRPRGEWVRELVKGQCDTRGKGLADILDVLGSE